MAVFDPNAASTEDIADMLAAADIIEWIASQSVERDDPQHLLAGLSDRLQASGVPVWYIELGIGTVDPSYRGISYARWQDRPPITEAVPHDPDGKNGFLDTPTYYAMSRGLLSARWNLEQPICENEPATLRAFRDQGATDYILRRVRFPRPEVTPNGLALSFATTAPGGFSDRQLRQIDRIIPALALAGRTISLARATAEALRIYLGPRTAQRVLDGDIRRGHGQTISAAIMIADLRGFTALSEREDAVRVVGWLDEHLEVIGAAVAASGGEILKFLGDGLLAIFPFDDMHAKEACGRAILAAQSALKRTAELNGRRAKHGGPTLALGIALHAGDVVYGNIGAARRQDFTVIGSAVNEAARMEGLCGSLGRDLLLSDTFATLSGRATESLGNFDLRGLAGTRTIRVLTDLIP